MKATALAVRAACADATVVVACGRNAALKAELETVENMIALGFTKAIDEWMAASDLLLTKAGPGTIAEAAALGLPVLLTGYLPGQEFGNVSYVEQEGMGAFERDPAAIAATAKAWLGDDAKLAALAAAARGAARPDATLDIAKDLAAMAKESAAFALELARPTLEVIKEDPTQAAPWVAGLLVCMRQRGFNRVVLLGTVAAAWTSLENVELIEGVAPEHVRLAVVALLALLPALGRRKGHPERLGAAGAVRSPHHAAHRRRLVAF